MADNKTNPNFDRATDTDYQSLQNRVTQNVGGLSEAGATQAGPQPGSEIQPTAAGNTAGSNGSYGQRDVGRGNPASWTQTSSGEGSRNPDDGSLEGQPIERDPLRDALLRCLTGSSIPTDGSALDVISRKYTARPDGEITPSSGSGF